MISHRRYESLDQADRGWLRARYHFIVSAEGNQAHGPVGPLFVMNDDEFAVDGGFPMHSHRDVEIITYVRQGVLGHRDSMGSEGTLRAGDVQVMSAGRGIRHSEFNVGDVPLKLYQIWLAPRAAGGRPTWDTKPFPKGDRAGRFVVLASGYGNDEGALAIRADARLLCATLKSGERVRQSLGRSHQAYLAVASGKIELNGESMGYGDGAAIAEVETAEIVALEDCELVMVDVPGVRP